MSFIRRAFAVTIAGNSASVVDKLGFQGNRCQVEGIKLQVEKSGNEDNAVDKGRKTADSLEATVGKQIQQIVTDKYPAMSLDDDLTEDELIEMLRKLDEDAAAIKKKEAEEAEANAQKESDDETAAAKAKAGEDEKSDWMTTTT